jgi:hypothetical protein
MGVIGSYIRSWERPGDLPRLIEILCPFASGAQRNERKETKISIMKITLRGCVTDGLSPTSDIYLVSYMSYWINGLSPTSDIYLVSYMSYWINGLVV